MKYSAYIGRVGALAVALGIGAAVANGPAIAVAEGNESGQSNTGAEASPNTPADETPAADGQLDGDQGGDGSETEPPGDAVDEVEDDAANADFAEDLGALEGDLGGGEQDEQGSDVLEPSGESDTGPSGSGDGPRAAGGSPAESQQGLQQHNESALQQFSSNTNVDNGFTGAQRSAGAEDDTSVQGFTTLAADDFSSETESLRTLALEEPAPAAQNPVTALFTLPLRIVNTVLSGILGGPSTPTGENPLVLGLLAFVRRQFAPFTRTFSNQAPVITGAQVDENEDGTFTITIDTEEPDVDAFDPDGDPLTFTAGNGEEGTVVKTGPNTFTYTPPETGWDGEDTITITASDPGGLFGFNRKSASVTVSVLAEGEDDPTQPEDPQPPVQQEDGTVQAELQFDPTKVTNVTIAPGFEPKYWNVQETYNPDTGKYEAVLTPTLVGQIRAALGLDTTDTLGLQVTTAPTETQMVQTFAFRAMSFTTLADAPDYTVNLPDIPAGHFEVGDPIVASPGELDPESLFPAGVVVTDRYAYVVTSRVFGTGGQPTVSVIGADPNKADYLQVIEEIPVGAAVLAGLAEDRLYVVNFLGPLAVIDIDGDDPAVEDDDNTVLTPVEMSPSGGIIPIVSPDQKTLYVVNQGRGDIYVVDVDPASATYHSKVGTIDVADDITFVDNGDGTDTVTYKVPLSGAFNADGTRMYLVRTNHIYEQDRTTFQISGYRYSTEIVTIDTATNEIVGDPVALAGDYGYFASSDGKYVYVPVLTMNGFDPTENNDISPITGSVNVIDVQDPDNPVVVANLPAGNLPVNIAFSPDKSVAYVVDAGKGTVYLIDTVNQEVLDLDPEADGLQGLVFESDPSAQLGEALNVIASSPDGARLFVTNFIKGTIIPLEFVTDTV